MKVRLNLGCGARILDGYDNYDDGSSSKNTFNPSAKRMDLNRLPWDFPDNYADEILMEQVLEHLPDTYAIVNEVKRVLKPGGIFRGEVPFAFSNAGMNHPQHYRHFTHISFAHLAEDFGFKLVKAELASDFARSREPYKRVRDLFLKLLPRAGRYWAAYHFNNVFDNVEFELAKP